MSTLPDHLSVHATSVMPDQALHAPMLTNVLKIDLITVTAKQLAPTTTDHLRVPALMDTKATEQHASTLMNALQMSSLAKRIQAAKIPTVVLNANATTVSSSLAESVKTLTNVPSTTTVLPTPSAPIKLADTSVNATKVSKVTVRTATTSTNATKKTFATKMQFVRTIKALTSVPVTSAMSCSKVADVKTSMSAPVKTTVASTQRVLTTKAPTPANAMNTTKVMEPYATLFRSTNARPKTTAPLLLKLVSIKSLATTVFVPTAMNVSTTTA